MLVLARQRGESIVIRGDITIQVLAVLGDTVRLGIEAPKDVPVDREEIHRAKLRDPHGKPEPGP